MKAINAFDYAQLAESSYVLFDALQGIYDDSSVKGILLDPIQEGVFSQSQAEDFVTTWQLISHTKNTSNGSLPRCSSTRKLASMSMPCVALSNLSMTLR